MSRFRLFTRLALFVGIVVGVLIMPAIAGADNASDLDYHENVREAVALADGSSGVLAEINATGALLVEIESGITVGDVTANTTITECSPGTDADNLGKAEDAAHASSDVGVLMIAVENDTLADLAADGDNAVLQVGGAGALYVKGDKREDDAAANNDYGFVMLAIQDDAPLASKIGATDDYGCLSLDDVGHLYSRDMSVNAEDAAMTSGDEGQFVLGIVSTTLGAAGEIAGTTGDFAAFTIGAEGALYVMGNQPEDTAFTTGDHGMPIMAVKDDTLADVAGDADYASVTVGAEGALYVCGDQVEDTAAGDADYGMPILTIRNDALAALAGTDGDYAMLQVNATGALFATIQGVAALDIGKAEDAAHSSSDTGVPSWAVRNDALAALGGADNDYSPLQVNDIGALFVTGEHIEDAAHVTGDYGNQVLAVRNDALAALGGTDGDYAPLQVDALGALFVTNDAVEYAEDAAHTTADGGVQMLAVRNDSLAALAGADGDYSPLQVNEAGALYVSESTEARLTAIVDTGEFNAGVDLLAAHGSKKYRIYKITIGSLAAEVTTLTDITPTIMYTAANGVCTFDYGSTGLVQTTAATAVTADTADASSCWAIVEYSIEP